MNPALAFILLITLTPPQPGVEVELILYRQEGTAWIEGPAGRCVTDVQGACQIRADGQPWGDGLLRGELRWAGGKRALIWPGGELALELSPNMASEARYDFLPGDPEAAPHIRRQGAAWLPLLLAAGILIGSAWLALKGGRQ